MKVLQIFFIYCSLTEQGSASQPILILNLVQPTSFLSLRVARKNKGRVILLES